MTWKQKKIIEVVFVLWYGNLGQQNFPEFLLQPTKMIYSKNERKKEEIDALREFNSGGFQSLSFLLAAS